MSFWLPCSAQLYDRAQVTQKSIQANLARYFGHTGLGLLPEGKRPCPRGAAVPAQFHLPNSAILAFRNTRKTLAGQQPEISRQRDSVNGYRSCQSGNRHRTCRGACNEEGELGRLQPTGPQNLCIVLRYHPGGAPETPGHAAVCHNCTLRSNGSMHFIFHK